MTADVTTREAAISTARAFAPPVSAFADDEWITLAVRMPCGPGALSPWQALLVNAGIAGPVKLVLAAGGLDLEARVEIPTEDGVDPGARVRQACESLRRLASGGPADTATCTDAASGALDLPSLATDAGWPFVLRSSGRLAIDLAVSGQFHQALVEPRAAGCRVRASLVVVVGPSARSRFALGALLLTVTGLVRMVRAGAVEQPGETMVFVETDLAKRPTAPELHHALCALAVACRMAGRETKALLDERIASAYLAARGWAAHV